MDVIRQKKCFESSHDTDDIIDGQQSLALLAKEGECSDFDDSADSLESQSPIDPPTSRNAYQRGWVSDFAVAWPKMPKWWLLVILFVVLVAISVTVLATITISRPSNTVWPDCGGTPEEARRRGCSFDMISHAWQTRECYDQEINEQYMKAGKWEYYIDADPNKPVSVDVVRAGETDVWLREAQHLVHCTYMWLQMHRAFTILHHIDSHLSNYNHTLHCQTYLLANPDGQKLDVFGRVIYPMCHPV